MYPKFNWWVGIVEDRADPAMLGRCRVRIIGYHTEDKNELPTVDLPWAVPVTPTTSPGISGIGETPSFVQGTTVLGFFSDGEDEQLPIIIGTLPGKPRNKRDKDIGFSVPPFESIFSLNLEATSLLKIPFSKKYSKASASKTSAHL